MASSKFRQTSLGKFLVLSTFVLVSGCGVPTAQLTKQDVAQLSDSDLCGRYAYSVKIREVVPILDAERRKRRLSCSSQLDSTVGDCSKMQITSYGPVDAARGQGNVYTVRNSSQKPRRFRIYHAGISSSEFKIRSNSTQEFGVGTSTLVATIGASSSGGGGPELYGCQAL